MFKRIFGFLALAFSLFGTQCLAQSCTVEEPNCHTFTPSTSPTQFTYNFVDGSKLTVRFVIVLTPFDLRVGESHPTDSTAICEGPCPNPIMLDPAEFPSGTVCVGYPGNFQGECNQYDFTGNAGGPHGVPRRNIDYRQMIELTLSYFTDQSVDTPAFAHAPGDITTFTVDILTGYFTPSTPPSPSPSPFPFTSLSPSPSDPTMDGLVPGLSSVVALDEPHSETDTFCWVSPATPDQMYTAGQEIEVSFRLFASGTCPGNPGMPIRDKMARLSLSRVDPTTGETVFPPLREKEEGNKFHWDHENGLNEFDLSTEGLAPGTYTITVFGSKFSPTSRDIMLNGNPGCLVIF